MNFGNTISWGKPFFANTQIEQTLMVGQFTNAITLQPSIFSRINEISNIEMNWDGRNAIAPNVHTLSHIRGFINNANDELLDRIKEENVFPNPHGTIAIRFSNKNNFFKMEFGESYANYYAYINGETKYRKEKERRLHEYIPYEIFQALDELFSS